MAENKNSIDYRVKIGELPQPDIVKEYYINQDHSYRNSQAHFNMSKSTWESYTKKYDIKKGNNPIIEQKIKNIKKIDSKEEKKEEVKETKPEIEQVFNNIPLEKLKEVIGVEENEEAEEKQEEQASDIQSSYSEQFNTIKLKYKKSPDMIEACKKSEEERSNFDNYDLEGAMFEFCFKNNIFYCEQLVKRIIFNFHEYADISDLSEEYIKELNDTEEYKNRDFFSQIKKDNFVKIYSEDLLLLTLTEEDKKNRQQVITILGYDPFTEDNFEDRPELYRDLTDLLSESMRKDATKKKAAVEIVHNYLNISKYQKKVKTLMDTGLIDADTQKALDGYLAMIAKIQASINQTTKENGFSGGRSIGSNGHGMLSDVMNQVEEQGYDKGITNFYDIATSKAIKEIADISYASMLNQIQLSKTDYADIICQQNLIVRESQLKARKALEGIRLCKEKIKKQELLKELEKEYREKGISEQETEEFIKSEYDMYEVK